MRIIIYLLATLFAFASTGQTKIKGQYFLKAGMVVNELKIRKNHSFKLRKVNWESGNGAIYYGKWILKNDTLVLEYRYCSSVKGAGRARTKTSLRKEKETQTDTLFVSGSDLCFSLPAGGHGYKRK